MATVDRKLGDIADALSDACISLEDCANELRGHIMANLRVGNTAHFLIAVASQCLPYIGYPRAMNAVKTIAEVAHSDKQTV